MEKDLLKSAKTMLIRDEDLREKPYLDTLGNITIGVGYNLTARGIPLKYLLQWCDEDIEYYHHQLDSDLSYFKRLTEARKLVLINMAYNMGMKNLLLFKKMFAALKNEKYLIASEEMLNSKWAKQVGQRAQRLAVMMVDG